MKTCRIFVSKLTESGFYSSGFGIDKKYISECNPKGYYKIVVEPIVVQGNKDKGLIRCCPFKNGYVVEGFGSIICGSLEQINNLVSSIRKTYDTSKPKEIIYTNLTL